MKWIQYTTKGGLQAQVAVIGTIEETVASLHEDMLDPSAFTIIDDGAELVLGETDKLREQIRIDEIKIKALTDELAVTNDVLQDLILTTLGG